MALGCATSLAFGMAAALPAAAQSMRTAEGAQQFLADTAKKVQTRVQFVDAAGRANYVTGKYTGDVKTIKGGLRKQKETIEALPEKPVDKKVSDISASLIEAIDAWGRPSACATRITEVTAPPYDDVKSDARNDTRSFSWTLTYTNEAWKYEPLTKFTSPAQVIDWSNAAFYRSAEGGITISSKGQAFPSIHLTYIASDPDLADRIEYAMKFLMMSCSDNAIAGL
jgi:hypothetical protein